MEEIKEEDLYVLIDRFGYTKSIDSATYSRTSEEVLKDYPHIVPMKNTDKLCVFTAQGNMYQVKGMTIPRCKMKDKGTLIHALCKLDKDEVVHYTSFEALFESMLFFTTKRGYVKLVSGTEFETNRSVISATKLEPEDTIVSINQLCSHEVTAEDTRVFLLTKEGLSLTFPLEEVSQLKRSSRGVKGISLVGEDTVVFGAVFSPETTTLSYNQKALHIGKLKNRRRCARGQKNKL